MAYQYMKVAASRPAWRVLKDALCNRPDFREGRCSVSTRMEGTERSDLVSPNTATTSCSVSTRMEGTES